MYEMAETPEGMSKAFDSFMQEFAVVGADGKQVMDESGQPVYGLAGTLVLASVHDRADADGRAFGVQVELARVQRGQVAPAQQRPDEPGLGPGDALHLLGEVAVLVSVAGQCLVQAGPHDLGV